MSSDMQTNSVETPVFCKGDVRVSLFPAVKYTLSTYQSRGEDQTDDQAEEESVSEYRPDGCKLYWTSSLDGLTSQSCCPARRPC